MSSHSLYLIINLVLCISFQQPVTGLQCLQCGLYDNLIPSCDSPSPNVTLKECAGAKPTCFDMLENVNVSGTKLWKIVRFCSPDGTGTVVPQDLSGGDEGTCKNNKRKVQRIRETAVGCATDFCNSRRTEDVLRKWKAMPANINEQDYYEEKKMRFCPTTCPNNGQEEAQSRRTHVRPRPASNINRVCSAG